MTGRRAGTWWCVAGYASLVWAVICSSAGAEGKITYRNYFERQTGCVNIVIV